MKFKNNIELNNSSRLFLGTSSLGGEIFHNGTDNYWKLKLGDLKIQDNANVKFTFGRTTGNFTATGVGTFGGEIKVSKSGTGAKLTIERTVTAPSTFTMENTADALVRDYVGGTNGHIWKTEGVQGMKLYESGKLEVLNTLEIQGTGNSSFAGNVGIGNTSPTQKLDVTGTIQGTRLNGYAANGSAPSLKIGRVDNASYWDFTHAGNDLRIYSNSGVGSDILLSIDSAGTDKLNKVGIGTATPTTKLDVDGVITATGGNSTQWNATTSGGPYLPLAGGTLTGALNVQESSGSSVLTIGNAGVGAEHYANVQMAGAGMFGGYYIQGTKRLYSNTTSNTQTRLGSTDSVRLEINEAVKLIVNSAGNVGIGTTAPLAKLDLRSSNAVSTNLSTAKSNAVAILRPATSLDLYLGVSSSSTDVISLQAFNGVTTTGRKIALQPFGGDVGIGTTTPNTKFEVKTSTANQWPAAINGYGINAGEYSGLQIHTGYGGDFNKWVGIAAVAESGASNTTGMAFYTSESTAVHTEKMRIANDGIVTITNPAAAHLVLYGDSNNSGDSGEVDGIIDFRGDAGGYGYRINTENWAGQTALNFQEYISGAYTSRLLISKTGNIGIGTTNPISQLEVNYNSLYTGSENAKHGIKIGGQATGDQNLILGADTTNTVSYVQSVVDNTTVGVLALNPRGGNVAIGAATASYKLDVNGTIGFVGSVYGNSKEAIRTSDSWLRLNPANLFTAGIYLSNSVLRTDNQIVVGSSSECRFRASGNSHVNNTSGNFGIGVSSPSAKLEVVSSTDYSTIKMNRSAVNGTQRTGLVSQHYSSAEQDITLVNGYCDTNNSYLSLGGSGSANNAIKTIRFFTGTNTTTLNGTERMRIASSGYVGIGTTNPTSILHIGDTTPILKIVSTSYFNDSFIEMGNGAIADVGKISCFNNPGISALELKFDNGSTGDARIRVGQRYLDFGIDSGTAMYINSSKNVGIGTSAPTEKLEVSGNVKADKYIGQQIWVSSNFRHRDTHLIGYYYFPFNNVSVSNATSYANVYIPANAGTVDKIILKNVNVASAATSTLLRVLINGTVTFTSAALTSTATLYASITTAVTSSTFVAGDRIQIQLDANAEWNDVSAIIECSIT